MSSQALAEVERRHILGVMRQCGNNRTQTASALGISLRGLRNKLAKYAEIPDETAAECVAGVYAGLNALPAQIVAIDPLGVIIFANDAWRRVVGDAQQDIGLGVNYLGECRSAASRGCRDAEVVLEGILRVSRGKQARFTYVYEAPIGERFHLCQLDAVPSIGGGALLVHTDVGSMATDGETGLLTRPHFDAQVRLSISEAGRRSLSIGLVVVTLQHVPRAAKIFGMEVSAHAIQQVARRLKRASNLTSFSGYLGDDELAVVQSGAIDGAYLAELVDHVASECTKPVMFEGQLTGIVMGISSAIFPAAECDSRKLIDAARANLTRGESTRSAFEPKRLKRAISQ